MTIFDLGDCKATAKCHYVEKLFEWCLKLNGDRRKRKHEDAEEVKNQYTGEAQKRQENTYGRTSGSVLNGTHTQKQ